MEYRVRVNLLSTAIVIAIGVTVSLITSAVVASKAYRARGEQNAKQSQEITVKGSARMPVKSDLGVWRIDVHGEADDLADAFAVLDERVSRVRDYLGRTGFAASEIDLTAIETEAHHERDEDGRATREIESFTLERTFIVTSADVERIAAAAGEVTSLISDGVPVRSRTPAFTYTKVAEKKIEILGRASADARRRAEEIAAKSGCRIGEVRRARMGVMQITQPHSTAVASYGIYDTSTIDKHIRVVVTATFALEPD